MNAHVKIKKGDTVLVSKGKNRGKTGKVLRIYPKSQKRTVEGINEKIRHTRPRRGGEKGQKVSIFHPIWIANALVVCPSCGKGTRVGYDVKDKIKVRVCKKCKGNL